MEYSCSYCSNLKSPWYCPCRNCGQTSMRRANMSVHMQRKHPGEYNPFEQFKDPNYPYKKHSPQLQTPENLGSVLPQSPDNAGFFLPQIDWSDHKQVAERFTNLEVLLNDIKKLSKYERICLLSAIANLP